jgi:hypothetical protein
MTPMHVQLPRPRAWLESGPFALWSLLMGCYALDSATSACQRTPAYCAAAVGEETVVPGVRGGAEVASLSGVYRLLSADTRARVEQELVACAESADAQVNRLHFAGLKPTRQQCQEVLSSKDPCGRTVTRAMQLGSQKHHLALQCAQERLGEWIPGRFSLEQRYRYDKQTGTRQLVTRQEAKALLRQGCGDELVGTLVPDVVLHSGDPIEALAVYDFKFPCPSGNAPKWTDYPEGHPYYREDQGTMYKMALGPQPYRVSPVWGIY